MEKNFALSIRVLEFLIQALLHEAYLETVHFTLGLSVPIHKMTMTRTFRKKNATLEHYLY